VIQSDAPYRMNADAFSDFYLPSSLTSARTSTTPAAASGGVSSSGAASLMPMVPLSSVVHPKWVMGSPSLVRFNGYSAIEVQGQPAPGKSSGEAMRAMETIITNDLPKGFSFDWAGQSLQEIVSGSQAPMLFTLSILVVFLCLAALYESWTIPVAVLLIVPLGVLGAVVAADVRGLPNDVYFKIGLITIIGLAAKNAILIVEFAVELQRQGRTVRQAVVEAGRLRMRPILMTSFAFILGVVPLVLAEGAGAEMRQSLGTAVFSGMLGVTLFGIFLTPVFYYVLSGLGESRLFASRTVQRISSTAMGGIGGLALGALLGRLGVVPSRWAEAVGASTGVLVMLVFIDITRRLRSKPASPINKPDQPAGPIDSPGGNEP
jgi:multidrug efflux pump